MIEHWTADITYIATRQGWLYLAVVMDLFARRIVGWAMADHMRASLVVSALQMGLQRRHPPKELVHHSDRGSQYTSTAFQTLLATYHIRPSVGRTGVGYDNAVTESFFASFKCERVRGQVYPTHKDLAPYSPWGYGIMQIFDARSFAISILACSLIPTPRLYLEFILNELERTCD